MVTEISIDKTKQNIQSETEKLENCKSAKFIPKEIESTEQLEKSVKELTEKLENLTYYEKIEHYASFHFNKNPVLVENAEKMQKISEREFIPSGEISDKCPLSGEICETAKTYSFDAVKQKFDLDNQTAIHALKSQNRYILEKEMQSINSEYNAVKSYSQEAERKLNRLIDANKLVESDNLYLKESFDYENKKQIDFCSQKISELQTDLNNFTKILEEKQAELSALIEPTPEKLPEALEIPELLRIKHIEFTAWNEEIIGANAINTNNAKLKEQRATEIKEKQSNLLEIGEKIVTLTQEISDYFSNLSNIVKQEFAGYISIDVELLEYVMSRDEYKDCFKITANGKTFPYECNGALQNNVKMQILYNLQRLKGYTGVTVMDNCEANTTQKINTLGLNCVSAYATFDKELIIK